MTEKSAFELHLEQLKQEYQKQLPDKLIKIETDWLSLQKKWNLELMVVLHRNVHSLIGSSGTFGFTEVSKRARELEIILKPLGNGNSTPDELLVTQVNTKIEELKSLCLI